MMKKACLGLLAALTMGAVAPATSQAGSFTVYIQNVNAKNTPTRSGTGSYRGIKDLFTTQANCRSSITQRVKDNKNSGFNTEAFAIVESRTAPKAGALTTGNCPTFIRGWWVYNPSRGYIGLAPMNQDELRDAERAIVRGQDAEPENAPAEMLPVQTLRSSNHLASLSRPSKMQSRRDWLRSEENRLLLII